MIRCKACGEDEALRLEELRSDELRLDDAADEVTITCESCGTSWLRDERLPCESCGSTDLVSRPMPLTQRSRGTQLSIVGWVNVDCCTTCDAPELQRSLAAGGPLSAGYIPAARRGR